MRIAYVSTQRPGYGGASTEAYGTIKWLRYLGHEVTGIFMVPQEDLDRCDPDQIGGIRTVVYPRHDKHETVAGEWDLLLGKNYEAARILRWRPEIPRVYITSGIDAVVKQLEARRKLANDWSYTVDTAKLPTTGPDITAFEAVTHVLAHSERDIAIYTKWLPAHLSAKILPCVRTAGLTVDPPGVYDYRDLAERKWDVCISASAWTREVKGGAVARQVCEHFRDAGSRIVACGEGFQLKGVDCPGLVSHRQMMEILRDSRTVLIPSLYDSCPSLYVEAVVAGCNVVVSSGVGNTEGHPFRLKVMDDSAKSYVKSVTHALSLSQQARYPITLPAYTARKLSDLLVKTVREANRE